MPHRDADNGDVDGEEESSRPGHPLPSRWSSATLSSSPSASLLTTEIGSFPRQVGTFSTGRVIAANRQFVCYSVANGHIRVIGAASGKMGLLKGHTGTVLDMELSRPTLEGESLLASVSTGGEIFVWRLQQKGEELITGVKASWRSAPGLTDGHYRRVLWWTANPAVTPGLLVVSSDSVDSVQLRDYAQPPPMTEINQAPSFARLYFGSGVTDAALTAEGKKLAVALSRGVIEVVDAGAGGREPAAVESSVNLSADGSAVNRVFFLSAWTPGAQSAQPTAILLAASILSDQSTFTLVHGFTRRTLSTFVLSHPSHVISSVAVDPTSSFLVLSHTSADKGEHGLAVIHIRKGGDPHLESARFDYFTSVTTAAPVVSFSLSNDGPDGPAAAVPWDPSTVDNVQLYCCCTKPIVQYHMRTDAVMRRVQEDELVEEKYPHPANTPVAQPREPLHAAAAPGLLLTPQAIRAASATSTPASAPPAFPPAASAAASPPAGGRMSITLTSASPTALATPVKVLQRPPAINSAVLSASIGSPSSSPTTSHHTAAALITSSRPTPEVPETPASSPMAGTLQPLAKIAQPPGVVTFATLSPATATSPASAPSSRREAHATSKRGGGEKDERASVAGVSALDALTEETGAADEGAPKERRRETQEANLLARLDKLFTRHLAKVNAAVQAQVERTLNLSKEEMEKDRKQRADVEKQRTEGLLKAVQQSLQGAGAGGAGSAQSSQQMEAAVERALTRSLTQTLLPEVQAAITSAVSSTSSSIGVDVDALATSVVQSLRAPLHESFKSTFGSVLLPGFEASTRAMFKQIETVYTRMSESNEEMMREKVEELLQERLGATANSHGRDDDLKEIHTALTTLVQTNSALQRTIVSLQQQQTQQNAAIAELKSLIQHQPPAQKSAATVPSPAPSQPAPAPAHVQPDYKTEIGLLLHQRQYEAAFTRALSLGKVPPVTWLCSQLDPIPLFHPSNPAHRLSPAVLLSLIQQLGYDLKDDVEVKLMWIKDALMVLQTTDSIIRPHVPDVLRGVSSRLEEQLNGAWKDAAHKTLQQQGRTVQHLISTTLEQM